MPVTVDYRQQLLEELEDLSPEELEKIYKLVVLLKEEFIAPGEGRYHTESWKRAEQEATEAYRRGGLKRYGSVDEMMDDILEKDED